MALLMAGLVLASAGGYWVWRTLHAGPLVAFPPASNPFYATVLNDHQPLPDFKLQRLGGKVSNADLAGHWTFLFFGYLQCPDVCPTALALMKDVRTRLVAQGTPAPLVLFVSVDPERDNLELLMTFVTTFDSAFVGATAADADLAPLVKHLGVFYQRNDANDSKRYTVDHTAAIYLIDPQGRLKAVFGPPQEAVRMSQDYTGITR